MIWQMDQMESWMRVMKNNDRRFDESSEANI